MLVIEFMVDTLFPLSDSWTIQSLFSRRLAEVEAEEEKVAVKWGNFLEITQKAFNF